MTQTNLWSATLKIHLLAIFSFLITTYYWHERVPDIANHNSILLMTSLISVALFVIAYERSIKAIVGSLFLFQVLLVSFSIALNHNYYVENFEKFQPYMGVKLLALAIAFLAPPIRWVGWGALSVVTFVMLAQYYSWPAEYSTQLGIQEPAMSLCFIIVAGILYINRLTTFRIIKKEIITDEKLSMIQKLSSVTMGLQHLNNTPLQTIEISLQLLKNKCPEGQSLIQSMERAYQSILRVNQIISDRNTVFGQKSATTLEEFQNDIKEMKQYLKN